ncbi:MAG TPA: glycosyltransferase family 2 protein [Polyangiales bacterium]|nr:glycosyltransferase family 2 protein [Polyangiales bacterium]
MALCLLAAGALCLLIALHPFGTYPLSLLLLKRIRGRPVDDLPTVSEDAASPDLAICMCAYNEERVIEAKLANLLALKRAYPKLEILVYVDGASDRTPELLQPYADRIRLHISKERHGKTHGMNLLVSMTKKPIVLFTDANVMIDLQAPARLMHHFADPAVGCVCGHLRYTNPGASVTAESGSLYWRLEEWTKRLESQTGSAIGADGSLFAIRRELHRAPPDHIIDDMFVSLTILCAGKRVVQSDDVDAYEESVVASREEFSRKVRIACQAFNVHRLLWKDLRQLDGLRLYQYVSHKLIRWFTIYFLIASALLIEAGLIAAGQIAVACSLLGLSGLVLIAGYYAWVRPAAQIWDILTAFAGAGVGVLRSLRGDQFQTWSLATSIRK